MNKLLSIIELSAKRSLWKVLAVLAVFAAGELAWFAWKLSADAEMNLYLAGPVFAACFAAMLLMVTLMVGGVRPSKTLSQQRIRLLGTSQQAFFLSEALFGLLCMLMVWAVQAAVVMAAAKIYTSQPGYAHGPQGPLLQIIAQKGLMMILPLKESMFWTGTVLSVLSLSLCTAHMRTKHRSKGVPLASYLALVILLSFYLGIAAEISTSPVIRPVIAFAVMVLAALYTCTHFEKERTEADDGE